MSSESHGVRPDNLADEAVATVTPVERLIWGSLLSRIYQSPTTRASRMVPKYGIRASAYDAVARLWMLPALPSGVALFVISGTKTSGVQHALVWLSATIFCLSLLLGFARFGSALAAARKYRGV
jgi:hypothetical protein